MQDKKLSWLLILGIVFLPFVFVWFTCKEGYSKNSRYLSFGWLLLVLIMMVKDGDFSSNEYDQSIIQNKKVVSETDNNEQRYTKARQTYDLVVQKEFYTGTVDSILGGWICENDQMPENLDDFIFISVAENKDKGRLALSFIEGQFDPRDPESIIAISEDQFTFRYKDYRFVPDGYEVHPLTIDYYYLDSLNELILFENNILNKGSLLQHAEYLKEVERFHSTLTELHPSTRKLFLHSSSAQINAHIKNHKERNPSRAKLLMDGQLKMMSAGLFNGNPELLASINQHFLHSNEVELFERKTVIKMKIRELSDNVLTLAKLNSFDNVSSYHEKVCAKYKPDEKSP